MRFGFAVKVIGAGSNGATLLADANRLFDLPDGASEGPRVIR